MSKQKEIIKEEEERFTTIGEYFESFLDNPNCRVIKVVIREIWGKSKVQQARLKLYVPEEICGTDTRDVRKWFLTLVAIPRDDIEKLIEKEEEKE